MFWFFLPGELLLFERIYHFQNRDDSKMKEFAPSGSKFFLLGVATILETVQGRTFQEIS